MKIERSFEGLFITMEEGLPKTQTYRRRVMNSGRPVILWALSFTMKPCSRPEAACEEGSKPTAA
jgi:hypothetical protein